nr:hypothetical protein T06A10.2 - Caenorhabditis elegans [Caenorhabditis elegans]
MLFLSYRIFDIDIGSCRSCRTPKFSATGNSMLYWDTRGEREKGTGDVIDTDYLHPTRPPHGASNRSRIKEGINFTNLIVSLCLIRILLHTIDPIFCFFRLIFRIISFARFRVSVSTGRSESSRSQHDAWKSKNRTNHNQNNKAHRIGITKPKIFLSIEGSRRQVHQEPPLRGSRLPQCKIPRLQRSDRSGAERRRQNLQLMANNSTSLCEGRVRRRM